MPGRRLASSRWPRFGVGRSTCGHDHCRLGSQFPNSRPWRGLSLYQFPYRGCLVVSPLCAPLARSVTSALYVAQTHVAWNAVSRNLLIKSHSPRFSGDGQKGSRPECHLGSQFPCSWRWRARGWPSAPGHWVLKKEHTRCAVPMHVAWKMVPERCPERSGIPRFAPGWSSWSPAHCRLDFRFPCSWLWLLRGCQNATGKGMCKADRSRWMAPENSEWRRVQKRCLAWSETHRFVSEQGRAGRANCSSGDRFRLPWLSRPRGRRRVPAEGIWKSEHDHPGSLRKTPCRCPYF